MSATIKHAPAKGQEFPVPLRTKRDPLEPLGLRLDYRTACTPWGAETGDGGRRVFTVAIQPDGTTDWERVTCKRCNR
jgi:hypothetical protein